MTIDWDVIHTLRNYFIETETNDPVQSMSESAYAQFSDLLNQALVENPDDAKLLFWQGWGHQFFHKEKEFEYAEYAYERALKLTPDFAPAIIALTYLHWQTAHQRALATVQEDIKQRYNIAPGASIDSIDIDKLMKEVEEIPKRVREIASFEEAQNTWRKYSTRKHEYNGKEYDYDVIDPSQGNFEAWWAGDKLVLYQLFKEMSDDLGADAELLTRQYYYFALFLLNEYDPLGQSPIVKQAFEAVRRYNGKTPSRYLADALANLAGGSSESNEKDHSPQYGLRLLQQLLDLYEENQDNKDVVRASAFYVFDRHLSDFITLNPVFCSENPKDCIALYERAQRLGLFSDTDEQVHVYIGRFYGQIGEYEKAANQFELVGKYFAEYHEFHWDYIEALVHLKRSDVAARFLQGLPEGGGQNRVVSVVTRLLLELRASDDSVEQLVQAFDKRLQQSPKLPTEADIEKRCQELWVEYWYVFPERLRQAVMTAEYAYEFMQNGKLWDFSMVGAQWGKAAEIAFEYSFVLPFSQYLDRHHISEVVTYPNGRNRPENSKRLIGPDLSPENLLKRKQHERIGLLWAASADRHHPAIKMLTEMKLDVNLWTGRVPKLLDAVNRLRNQFVHPKSPSTLEDVRELRSILMAKGLLADMGQATVNQRFLQ